MNKKYTKSKKFDDLTLAYGLSKRMNGFAFCFSGDEELKRLGFMVHTRLDLNPYITVKGKKFLMDVLKPLAEEIPVDKPKEDDKKKKVNELVKNIKDQRPIEKGYFEPDEDDDEEEFEEIKYKDKK